MSETERLDLQICIARIIWCKQREQYQRAVQNGEEYLRKKYLLEFLAAQNRLYGLKIQKTQGGITP